jgi:hypothetical protein
LGQGEGFVGIGRFELKRPTALSPAAAVALDRQELPWRQDVGGSSVSNGLHHPIAGTQLIDDPIAPRIVNLVNVGAVPLVSQSASPSLGRFSLFALALRDVEVPEATDDP